MSVRRPLHVALTLALLAAAAPLAAQSERFELSLLVLPGGSYSEYEGLDFDLGWGAGAGWRWSEAWSGELRGTRREHDGRFSELALDTLELGVRRHFLAGADWQPFLQVGVLRQESERRHQVVCVEPVTGPCPPLVDDESENGGFVGGGMDWRFTRRVALRLDGRAVFYDSERSGDSEDRVDVSAGLVVRF